MNNKFILFTNLFLILLLIFINTVSAQFVWSKIIFFLIIFCLVFSLLTIFSKKIKRNLLGSFYSIALLLLLLFNQFSYLNVVLLTVFFISILFVFKSKFTP